MNRRCLYCYKDLDSKIGGDYHAYCSLDFFGTKEAPALAYSLNQMADLAKKVVERSVAVPGVQPKLSLTLIKDTMAGDNKGRLTIVGALGGNYILKPPSDVYPEIPQNEHLTMRMAATFNINTVKSSLIRLQSGELSYITRRVDRKENGEKIHMLDMFQIIEATDKYKSSMERVGKAIGQYSSNTLWDKLNFFELAVFCFLTGNNDMHLKNFSMIQAGADWVLAPAYDLLNVAIVNPDDKEELALTLEGKKKKLKRTHFEHLGTIVDLNKKQIDGVFKRVFNNKPAALALIENSFLSEKYRKDYINLMEERYKALLE